MKYFYTLLFLLTSLVGWGQCDVFITPLSAIVIDHNPGISFSFEIQNNDIIPYSGGSLYMDWTLSGFVSGPIWNFNLNPSPIPPGGSRYVSTPVFDIPLPANVPGNWDPYGGWTGNSYISFFKLALEANGECFQWVLNSDGTWWDEPLSDGCLNPNGDNFCDDACDVELIDFNLETGEITLIPYSTYCPNIGNSNWSDQYPYDDPFIFGFVLNFNIGGISTNVSIGGQNIYASGDVLIIDLDNPILNDLLESILESINSGENCELIITLYNLNNTGQFIGNAPENQIIELINLCPIIEGCIDPEASNYNPWATEDDGSCIYDIYGCTDPQANNYDPTATIDDESCLYDVLGCTDNSAINYNPLANLDDGSCEYNVFGCTDPSATNYNPLATVDDGNCTYDVLGCTDSFATNYNPLATLDDGNCEYIFYLEGCTDFSAINYNEAAVIDNGSCVYDLCDAIWIPNVFSPNNDGMNDGWTVEADPECWLEWDVRIFNRWGQLIWQSNIVGEVWDGSNNNGNYYVADGIYIYAVRGIGYLPSNTFQTTGNIMIFR